MKDKSDNDIDVISIVNMVFYREILKFFDDEKNQPGLDKLAKDLKKVSKWDYGLLDLRKRAESIIWDYSTSKKIQDSLMVVIKLKISQSLAAQITFEIMWNLISRLNHELQMSENQKMQEDAIDLSKEIRKIVDELCANTEFVTKYNIKPIKSTDLSDYSSYLKSSNYTSQRVLPTRILEVYAELDYLMSSPFAKNEITIQPLLSNKFSSMLERILKFAKVSGKVAGLNYSLFEEPQQENIWKSAMNNHEFARGFGQGLASSLPSLSNKIQERILSEVKKNMEFARGFGECLGPNLRTLPEKLRKLIFEIAVDSAPLSDGLDKSIASPLPQYSSSRTISTAANLSFESTVNISFMVRPLRTSAIMHVKYPLRVSIGLNAPKIQLEVEELDLISVILGLTDVKLELLTENSESLGTIRVTEDFPWQLRYEAISNIEGQRQGIQFSSSKIKVENKSSYVGSGRYDCIVFLQGDMEVMEQIERVTYLLHPTFDNSLIDSFDSESGFRIKINVWGEFRIQIKLKFKDGHIELMSHWLALTSKAAINDKMSA